MSRKGVLREFVGGPWDGQKHWVPADQMMVEATQEMDLERQLEASITVVEGGLADISFKRVRYWLTQFGTFEIEEGS